MAVSPTIHNIMTLGLTILSIMGFIAVLSIMTQYNKLQHNLMQSIFTFMPLVVMLSVVKLSARNPW
jgi:hypothetical protein